MNRQYSSKISGLVAFAALICVPGQARLQLVQHVIGTEPTIIWGVEPSYTRPTSAAPSMLQLDSAKAAGFDWVQTYGGVKIENRDDSVTCFLDSLGKHGFRVLASVERLIDGHIDTAFLRRKVSRWKSSNTIGAWELVDEPDVKGVDPRELATAYSIVKSIDSIRPVVIVWSGVGTRSDIEEFGRTFDWAAIDVYPVSRLGYDSGAIAARVGALQQHIALQSRPLTPIVQGFGDVRRHEPTLSEFQLMVSEFNRAGATYGIAVYAWNIPGWSRNLGQRRLWPLLLSAPASLHNQAEQ